MSEETMVLILLAYPVIGMAIGAMMMRRYRERDVGFGIFVAMIWPMLIVGLLIGLAAMIWPMLIVGLLIGLAFAFVLDKLDLDLFD
jgi:hypothetical protein